jgi:methyl-accepting chemotaxis protein
MDWVRNMKVGVKLMAAFGVVTLMLGVLGFVGMSNTAKFSKDFESLYGDRLVPAVDLAKVNAGVLTLRVSSLQWVMSHDPAERAKIDEADKKRIADIEELVKKYAATYLIQSEKDGLKAWDECFPAYLAARSRMLSLYEAGRTDEADAVRSNDVAPLGLKVSAVVDQLCDIQASYGAEMQKEVDRQAKSSMLLMVALLIVAPLIAISTGVVLSRAIAGTLNHVVDQATLAATGDLRVRVNVESQDELGVMGEKLNVMMQTFDDNMAKVAMASQAITTASSELSSASQSISAGAQEQASSLEETAASLEEMTSAVKQNADNAQQAAQLARGAREVAEKGGKVVGEAVEAMREINASSRKIADIITAIDEIAFQTNLLALNAAVEAARAGEQGRGFAVVAGEVRNLAQRSASAAKEIKGLINDSVDKVESGSKLVNQSGVQLEEIVTSVKRVTDIVAEIAASSREQSTGIEQVNTAVTQMDSVTQSNASQTEELAGTADGLSSQAQGMMTLVQQFKLTEGGQAASSTAHVSRPRAKVLPMRKAGVHAARKTAPVAAATGTDGFEEF